MDSWIRAILRIYEFAAILTITILPALATVYAIIVSFLGRLVRHADEEFRRLKKENEERIAARRKELGKRDKRRKTIRGALAEVRGWEEELKGLIKKEENWKKQVEGWSFSSIFVKPAGWILGGLLGILVAYGTLNVLPSSLYCWRILLSLIPFFGGLAFVAVGLCKHVIPCLMEIDGSARKPEETPVEAVHRILREQTERSSKEQRETFERLIVKMDGVVEGLERLYSQKEPEFKVRFEVNNKEVTPLMLEKGKEQPVVLVVENRSQFAVQEPAVTVDVPVQLKLSKAGGLLYIPHPANFTEYLSTMRYMFLRKIPIRLKGEEGGKYYVTIYIDSSSHKPYETKLEVIVE